MVSYNRYSNYKLQRENDSDYHSYPLSNTGATEIYGALYLIGNPCTIDVFGWSLTGLDYGQTCGAFFALYLGENDTLGPNHSNIMFHNYTGSPIDYSDYHNGTAGNLCSGYGCLIQEPNNVGAVLWAGGSSLIDEIGVLVDNYTQAGMFSTLLHYVYFALSR